MRVSARIYVDLRETNKKKITSKYSASVISLYDGTSNSPLRMAYILSKLRPVSFFNND